MNFIPGWEKIVKDPINPDLLWPYGISLLGLNMNKLILEFWRNQKGSSLPDLSNIEILDRKKVLAMAFSLLSLSAPELAKAEAQITNNEIEWAIEATQKIDPVEYLINKKSERGVRDLMVQPLTESEKNILTWNLYHEARGENENGGIGILGVLLSSLERMRSPKFPATAEGVVFQEYQYSWALKIPENKIDHKVNVSSFLKLREIVNKFTREKTLDENISKLKDKMLSYAQLINFNLQNIPDRITHYHRLGMLTEKNFAEKASAETKIRISRIESLYGTEVGNKLGIIKLGRHLFYPDLKF